VIIW